LQPVDVFSSCPHFIVIVVGPNNNEMHVHSVARNKPTNVTVNVLQTELLFADQIHVFNCNISFAIMIQYCSTVYFACITDNP